MGMNFTRLNLHLIINLIYLKSTIKDPNKRGFI